MERKVLYVNTDSSVWANHLLMMKKQFINNINQALANNPVKDIKFFTGSIEKLLHLKKEDPDLKLKFLPLSETEKISIGQSVGKIKNEELQKKLAHFVKHVCSAKKHLLVKMIIRYANVAALPSVKRATYAVFVSVMKKSSCAQKIVAVLAAEPWLNYSDCQKYVKCDKMLFDSVKNSLKQYYYAKVFNSQATEKEEMTAVMIKTGMHPEKISEQLAQNLIKGLRRK